MLGKIASMTMNVATGGTYGLARWVWRRFRGDGDKPTFMGRVMALVVSHAIFSVLIGSVSIWGLFKGVGWVMAVILSTTGHYDVKPRDQGDGTILTGIEDAAKERIDRIHRDMEAKAAEREKVMKEEFDRRKKELDDRDLADVLARKKRDAEELIARKHSEAEAEIAKRRIEAEERIAKAKAEMQAKERELAAKVKDEIKEHIPSPMGWLFGGSKPDPNPLKIQCLECGESLAWPISAYDKQGVHPKCGFVIGKIGRVANYNPQAGNDYIVKCMFCDFQGSGTFNSKRYMGFKCPSCFKNQYICEGEAEYAGWWKVQKRRRDEAIAKIAEEKRQREERHRKNPNVHDLSPLDALTDSLPFDLAPRLDDPTGEFKPR